MQIKIDNRSSTPIYKQLVNAVSDAARKGELPHDYRLPSMNELAASEQISRETVKKAYAILTREGIIAPRQGKGFYIVERNADAKPRVLIIFDRLSVYKQIIFTAFTETLKGKANITMLAHNQSLDLLAHYLDTHLDSFDWYVVEPHFPLDEESQKLALKLISRIPNRKLIMLDRWMESMPGNYGAVFQNFENDIYEGLQQGLYRLERSRRLKVFTLPTSLYGPMIRKGIDRFAADYRIRVEYITETPSRISKGDVFLVLNSQLDWGLADLARKVAGNGLVIGKDVFIISYNDFALNEVVLGGLTTVSTDFEQMGRIAAEMILRGQLSKIHCNFRMNRRRTF